MDIRKSTQNDLARIMEIYSYAREYMASHGNPNQWGPTNWPPVELICEDIRLGQSYVCEEKIFEMYDGDEVRVKLECRNELMKYVIDRFGENVETESSNGETFICYADVCLSPTFYGWVVGFKGGIRILEPTEADREMKEMLNSFK